MKLRNISEQVMVITGATSGIGLTTARMAAEKGAQVLLIARNADALSRLADEIRSTAGEPSFTRRTSRTKARCGKPPTRRCRRSVGSILG